MAESGVKTHPTPSAHGAPLADVRIPSGGDYLSQQERAKLSPAVLAARSLALKPLLAEHAREAELLRRPVDAVWAEIRKAGFLYQFVPRRFGGLEVTLEEFMNAMLPLAEGDPSTGWTACFSTTHNWYLAHFPLEAQSEIWGSQPYFVAPDVTFPPGTAVRDGAGYRVSGRWKWGSGVMHSDWIFAKALVNTDGGPEMGHFIFPTRDAEVLDVWHVDGMAGTGSNDVMVRDLFVPEHRMMLMRRRSEAGAPAHPDSKLYSMPMLPLLSLCAAIPALGAARASVEHLRKRLLGHVTVGTAVSQMERPASQMRLARGDVMVRTAEIVLRTAAREGYELGGVKEPAQTEERIRIRALIAYAVGLCRDAITVLCDSAGSSLHFLDNPLQRCKRDVEVMSSHIVYDFDVASELHGRAMLGLPPNSPLN